ncbi:hypothetical protein MRX96_014237 [Rhipicephalus microplus]
MADGLPEGFLPCDGRQTKPAASFTYFRRTYQGRDTAGSHEPAVQTYAGDCEQRWSKALGTKGENIHTKKAPSNEKRTATATILGTPAILQNQSPCPETEIQASSSKDRGWPPRKDRK